MKPETDPMGLNTVAPAGGPAQSVLNRFVLPWATVGGADASHLTVLGFGLRPFPARWPAPFTRPILLLVPLCLQVLGQSYSIDGSSIAGGGGTSAGGGFTLAGTLGQHDAGSVASGGQYTLTGGFWALPTAVQVEGAPTLVIVPATPSDATISWTPDLPGWVLQHSGTLTPANWTNTLSGAVNPVVVPANESSGFYRLFKP